jgi:hypothetical protein
MQQQYFAVPLDFSVVLKSNTRRIGPVSLHGGCRQIALVAPRVSVARPLLIMSSASPICMEVA